MPYGPISGKTNVRIISKSRDLEEAYRHIKKVGAVALATQTDGDVVWCELYAITEGEIMPVITSRDGLEFDINYSSKTLRQMKRISKEREANQNE